MVDIKEHPAAPLISGIMDLENELAKRGKSIELNVVGGFAMMLRDNRDINDLTDIDYVGEPLEYEISSICDRIGMAHNLGAGWINNDLMLPGSTLEDLEVSTGKLHFDEAISLPHIKVNVLQEKDLLRMKLISVDTSFSAVELGGEFTRAKDFPDVIKLMQKLEMDFDDLKKEFSEYLINKNTIGIIDDFAKHGMDHAIEKIAELGLNLEDEKEEPGEFSWDVVTKIMGTRVLDELMRDSERKTEIEPERSPHRTRHREQELEPG